MKTEQRKCCCGGLPALWWWLLALLGAGLLYLGMIANKQNPIEQDLTQRSTETLTKLGYDWVKPVVDQRGRDVYLSGIALMRLAALRLFKTFKISMVCAR